MGHFTPYSPQSPGSNYVHNEHYNGILESLQVPDDLIDLKPEFIEMLDWPLEIWSKYERICDSAKHALVRKLKDQGNL